MKSLQCEKAKKKREENVKIRAAGNIHKNQKQTFASRVEQCDELREIGRERGERAERKNFEYLKLFENLRTCYGSAGSACTCGLFQTLSRSLVCQPFLIFYFFIFSIIFLSLATPNDVIRGVNGRRRRRRGRG